MSEIKPVFPDPDRRRHFTHDTRRHEVFESSESLLCKKGSFAFVFEGHAPNIHSHRML